MTGENVSAAIDDARTVPASWPAVRDDTPEPVWTIGGLPAVVMMPLMWVSPKRMGPRLAAAGWWAAVAAHLVALVIGLGFIAWGEDVAWQQRPWVFRAGPMAGTRGPVPPPNFTVWEFVRLPAAALVIHIHGATSRGGSVVPYVAGFVGFELAVLLIAVVMMPFGAAGERAGLLCGRCLRITMWSCSALIPVGIGWTLSAHYRHHLGLPAEWTSWDFLALTVAGGWWLVILSRSLYRYAGPADGPAWERRVPRCESCGYRISHLALTGCCPECGRPIERSIAGRRKPPAFATADTAGRAFVGFFSTLKGALCDREFFDQLVVRSGHARARAFFLRLVFLNTAVLCFLLLLGGFGHRGPIPLGHTWAGLSVCAFAVGVPQIMGAGLVTVVVALLGRRPILPTAITVFYGCSLLVVLSLFLSVPIALVRMMDLSLSGWAEDAVITTVAVYLSIVVVSAPWLVKMWARNPRRRMFRRTRFAND